MAEIKISKAEILALVKESNPELFENRVDDETDPGAFTGSTYPYYGSELTVARKMKLASYEKYINPALQSLKSMVSDVNSEYVNNNLQQADIEFLINDQMERLQAAVSYTVSSLQAIVKNDGQELVPAGPQFPSMMEEQEEQELGKEKVSSSDMKKAGYEQGKKAASASGLTAQERPLIKQLNDLLIKAATEGNIIPGKAGRLIKLLAAELEKIVQK